MLRLLPAKSTGPAFILGCSREWPHTVEGRADEKELLSVVRYVMEEWSMIERKATSHRLLKGHSAESES